MAVEWLQRDSARELLDSVDHFLVDIDGVCWNINDAIEGTFEALSFLKSKNKKIVFLSNNSTYTQEEYVDKFKRCGYDAKVEDICNTARLSALYLKTINFQGTVYVAGTESIGKELVKLGLKHIGTGPDFDRIEERRETWLSMKLDPEVRGVIVGFDNYFSTAKILKAASYIQRKGTVFLVTGEDPRLPGTTNIIIPDNGAMVAAVKVMARKEPISVGKPNTLVFDLVQKQHQLDPSRCCLIGDSFNTDIALARASGLKSVLVLSGLTKQADVDQLTSGESDLPKPDYYINKLADICSLLE